MPQARVISSRICRFVSLSSTIRTRVPLRSIVSGAAAAVSSISSRAVKAKVLPTPSALETDRLPPIIPTSCEAMFNPRPVPPKRRVVDASAWVKASKIFCCLAAGMPMPVSRTETRSSNGSRVPLSSTRTAISPASVNLTALLSRLASTCRRRTGSPLTRSGRSEGQLKVSSMCFCWALAAVSCTTCSRVWRNGKATDSSSRRPASILDRSRMSLRISSSDSAEPLTMSRYSRWVASRSVASASSVMPMTAFIGVRISWLMLVRNVLLARLASSAARRISSAASFSRAMASMARRRWSRSLARW